MNVIVLYVSVYFEADKLICVKNMPHFENRIIPKFQSKEQSNMKNLLRIAF